MKEYSEGESDTEFLLRIKDLKKEAQLHRIMFLWRKAYTRARGGSRLIYVFYHLHKHVLKYGTTKNLFGEKSNLIAIERKRR